MHFLGAAFVFLLLTGCHASPALLNEQKAAVLTTAMQGAIDQSVEFEEAAVMATTDDESQQFARRSEAAAKTVNQLRSEARNALKEAGDQGALQKLDEVDADWAKVVALDARILPLAVANTNLKAAALSQGKGMETLNKLTDALDQVEVQVTDASSLRALSDAEAAALRLQSLLAPHIAAADDATMASLEAQMKTQGEKVDTGLKALDEKLPKDAQAFVEPAKTAWKDYQAVNTEVLRLSHLNTNVLSLQLSVHDKRAVVEPTQRAVSELLEQIASTESRATR